MTLNPLRFASEVNKQYLRYQLTFARLADPMLDKQFKEKLWRTDSPLFKGPFVSLSRAFEEGAQVQDLIKEGLLHPRMGRIIRYERIYKHQENALRAIHAGRDVLLATGTGSGKTEAFLYPIITRCLRLNEDPKAPKGVVSLIVYPMNALANDQLARLRDYLVGTGVTFGMYTGDTPDDETRLPFEGKKLPPGTTPEQYRELHRKTQDRENFVLLPPEERFTRKQIQQNPPRLLLVNKAILEYILTRGDDLGILYGAPIEFLVMDEAHTNTGVYGAEVALLLRRVKALAKPPNGTITHIATSATIADENHEDEGRRFMGRLFGVPVPNVSVIREAYRGIAWPAQRIKVSPPPDAKTLFERALQAVGRPEGPEREREFEAVFHDLTGHPLPPEGVVQHRLFRGLLQLDFAYHLDHSALTPQPLEKLVQLTWSVAGRGVPGEGAQEELLTYLVLGASAELEGTPLFRPKLHYFVKGLEGAVVILNSGNAERTVMPEMFLSAELATRKYESRREPTAVFPIFVCPQCGQHHYQQHLEDITSESGDELKGGQQVDGGTLFRPDKARTEKRILFTDIIVQGNDEDDEGGTKHHKSGFVCYACGAIYLGSVETCHHCERRGTLLPIFILDSVERVKSCPVCRYNQGFGMQFYKDPFRALREVPVANVYVLAQAMLSEAEGAGRRLIIFADNRQETAFQAGWMQDRARRYRFRHLLYRHLVPYEKWAIEGPEKPSISIDALIDSLTKKLFQNKALAKIVASEVFEEAWDSPFDSRLKTSLKRFLTVQVLREITASYKTRASLDAWGRLRVHYFGIEPAYPAIQKIAASYNIKPEILVKWVENLLDGIRKRQMIYHPFVPIFSHTWDVRHDLVKNRYLPPIDFHPTGMRLERESGKNANPSVKTWIGRGGTTSVQDWLRALELKNEQKEPFLRDVWKLLVDELKLLARLASLRYGNGGVIKGTQNIYQIDARLIGVTRHSERYQCNFCGRIQSRSTPDNTCSRYRCSRGRITQMRDEEPRDYDLVVLDKAMREPQPVFVMAEEHTAQVPGTHRVRIEKAFKEGRDVNCLVATPTLELGVDIGALDMVLLRNVPPRSANYWQRAGRAGRRNRMALIYTYARTIAHDLHFFNRPDALLGGAVVPPRFNLQNPIMIRKHVHATVLTEIHAELLKTEGNWLNKVIPGVIGEVLFENGRPRTELDSIVAPLRQALADPARRESLLVALERTFTRQWPEPSPEVDQTRLQKYLDEMPDELKAAYHRVLSRLEWAYQQRRRLAKKEAEGGTLSEEEERFKRRCEETIRALNPQIWSKIETESERRRLYLQNYTLTVLSREGFLPGYAIAHDHVVASAERAYTRGWDPFGFDLPRPSPIAIHEHLPGNRIYANGGKYQVAYYKFPASQEIKNPLQWLVDPERFFAKNREETTAGYNNPNACELTSLPLVDSQLRFISHVDDFETTRFRMPSIVAGVLRRRHKGGYTFQIGARKLEYRRGQFVTLLNLGPSRGSEEQELGFPICRVCGGVRSPYEREIALEKFVEYHKKSCAEEPQKYALHIHTTVDGLLFENLNSAAETASLGEALIIACNHLFDMERDDLHLLMIPGEDDTWTLFLYDPMPGGSGLLQQLLDNWSDVVSAAKELLEKCSGACPQSCYDCLRTYYNQFYHDELDRNLAITLLNQMGPIDGQPTIIEPLSEIPSAETHEEDTNIWEKRLEAIVNEEWGFHGFQPQVRVDLPEINTYTQPDLAHIKGRIAIYLDGPIHDTTIQQSKDRLRRMALKAVGWEVIEIPIQDFENDQMMGAYKQIISRILERWYATC